jgi:uncharacterized protein DUF6438
MNSIYLTLLLSSALLVSGQSQKSPVITLERQACYGICPVYKVSIFADGSVVFEGKEHSKTKGIARGHITPAALKELMAAFDRVHYFDLQDEYRGDKNCPRARTDAPSAITSFSSNGRTKRIDHYLGCDGLQELKDLTELEGKIDKTVNSHRWIR